MFNIKPNILIISDTHGKTPLHPSSLSLLPTDDDAFLAADLTRAVTGYRHPLPPADVVVHCGDLTRRSTLREYQDTFSMLRSLRAPLKLVITGNHDHTLDSTYDFDSPQEYEVDEDVQAVWKVIRDVRQDGVQYLSEGTHDFTLANGAALRVYASQNNPRRMPIARSKDDPGNSPKARKRLVELSRQRRFLIDLTEEHTRIERDKKTLFVNAAILDVGYRPSQLPWIIDADLPGAAANVTA
ncbi:hypothetical protein QQS21_006075 [Conoideocrella luteorostrata]|uniref:Calcineurin-like phosphoesterase domain-containing protein n=1 Tax=Conoideocrella luteorostrata TaxID=1105319 RepID=A0AAJ0G0F1_9HYPO|nr:hypothetical protein QQS21_006075 [Conoideocrella luteorostrata]